MRVAQKFAGYSLAEADNLRKAMGKKSREVMAAARAAFEAGAERCGYGQALGKQLFDVIERFADYAFNKSHTFGYGLVTYQTAYLKAHYPVEYFACLLSSVKSNLDKAAVYLSDARSAGIKVLTPDINRSVMDFATVDPDEAAISATPSRRVARRDHVRAVGDPQRRRGLGRAAARRAQRQRHVPVVPRLRRASTRTRAQQAHGRVVDQGGGVRLTRSSATWFADGVRADHRRHAHPSSRTRPGRDEPLRRPRRRSSRGLRRADHHSGQRVRQERPSAVREGDARAVRIAITRCSGSKRRCAARSIAASPKRPSATTAPFWCSAG